MPAVARAFALVVAVGLLAACNTTSDRGSDGRWYLQRPTSY